MKKRSRRSRRARPTHYLGHSMARITRLRIFDERRIRYFVRMYLQRPQWRKTMSSRKEASHAPPLR